MRKKYHRFLQKNRNKGIPNLITYICIANAALYFYTLLTKNLAVANFLTFDCARILQGELWRTVTWIFSYGAAYIYEPLGFLYIFFFVLFNRWLEQFLSGVWGTLRVNIYYLGGALLSELTAIVIGVCFQIPVHLSIYYLNLSLMLAVATLVPEERILLFGVFPLKMRWLAVLDVALVLLEIFNAVSGYSGQTLRILLVIVGTAPLVSFINYLLNFGKDVQRLLPIKSSVQQRKRRQQFQRDAQPNPDWAKNYRSSTGERPYRHKCTVCGRTDTSNPGLEFRYCSRCKGYFCYCIEHINNHTHVE